MMALPAAGLGLPGIPACLFNLALTILWVVIGWRAMRAHERPAEYHDDLRQEIRRPANSRTALAKRNRNKFLLKLGHGLVYWTALQIGPFWAILGPVFALSGSGVLKGANWNTGKMGCPSTCA